MRRICQAWAFAALLRLWGASAQADEPDLVLQHGRVVTVDAEFSVHEALLVRDGRVLYVGANAEALAQAAPGAQVVDLQGKMVLPGLIDSHVHPSGAALHEFDHPIPEMNSIADVLAYVRQRAAALPAGQWIQVSQVFITRLQEQRYPTRQELDEAAPEHPVIFATGPDAALNSRALELSGIDRDFVVVGAGYIERDVNGEPTGILRSCTRYAKVESAARPISEEDRRQQLRLLLADYNATGLTTIADRSASADDVARYQTLLAQGELPLRVAVSRRIDGSASLEEATQALREIAADPLARRNLPTGAPPRVWIVGVKTFLDGGMLTGSAYLRAPWGVSAIYGIRDPEYRGVLFIERARLLPLVRATCELGLQFTAHCAGDGAVELLVDVYDEIDRDLPVRELRPCVTHANFHDLETIARAARLGVVMDIQPVWLYLDGKTLRDQFGDERMRYFHPLRTLLDAGVCVGGGSDHMQKIGRDRSVNSYNPFLGIETTLTRRARGLDGPLHAEESLTRAQALQMYTLDNARLLFQEDQIGSLEPGKLADLIVIDRDLLTCPLEEISETQVLYTYLGGEQVYPRP